MKKITLLLSSAFILIAGVFAQSEIKTIVNDANAEKRNIASFTSIDVSNSIVIYLSQGKEDAVAVSSTNATENKKILTQVKNGVLTISIENKWNDWGNKDIKAKAYISVKNLQSLKLSGASSCRIIEKIVADDLHVKLSGASSLKGNVAANKIKIEASGASNINVNGSAEEATFEASGASEIKGFDFDIKKCSVRASGASSLSFTVKEKLVANASGASSIKYKGLATNVNCNSTGASSIKRVTD